MSATLAIVVQQIVQVEVCPFCQKQNLAMASNSTAFCVRCRDCEACGPSGDNQAEAIDLWNAAGQRVSKEVKKAVEAAVKDVKEAPAGVGSGG